MKNCAILASLFLTLSCHAAASVSYGKPKKVESVSLVSLIANPDKYDAKPVRVVGAFQIKFEGKEICLHQEDLNGNVFANCLWIEPDFSALGVDARELSALNGQHVILEGVFRKDNHGHRGLFAGAITDIWRTQSWKRPPN